MTLPLIAIIGYYDRQNWGDDAFQEVFTKLFSDFELLFITADSIHDPSFISSIIPQLQRVNILICGGGDVMVPYFQKSVRILTDFLATRYNKYVPLIALGIGIGFISVFQTEMLSFYDYVFLRNRGYDLLLLQQCLGTLRANYLPDLVFSNLLFYPPCAIMDNPKKIFVCLAQPYFHNRLELLYEISDIMAKSLVLPIVLIPFNTHVPNSKENDLVWCDILMERHPGRFELQNMPSSINEAVTLFSQASFVIAHRFHSHVVSTMAGVPYISIETARKTHLLNSEISWDLVWKNPTLETLGTFIELIDVNPIQHQSKICEFRDTITRSWLTSWDKLQLLVRNTIESSGYRNVHCKHLTPRFLSPQPWFNRSEIVQALESKYHPRILQEFQNPKALENLARELCFDATGGMTGSEFVYGTIDHLKLGNANIASHLRAMIEYMADRTLLRPRVAFSDFSKDVLLPITLDIDYIHQTTFSDIHRCGWSFAIQLIRSFSPRIGSSLASGSMFCTPVPRSGGLICDVYMDRTFGWERESLKSFGIIPYTSPWIGFIHHGFNSPDWYTENTATAVFGSSEFEASIPTCVAIICLSEYLRDCVIQYLNRKFPKRFIQHIQIIKLFHPTQLLNIPQWTPSNLSHPFRVVSIGAWYRNTWTLVRLDNSEHQYTKTLLKPKSADGYYPPKNFDELEMMLIKANVVGSELALQDSEYSIFVKNVINYYHPLPVPIQDVMDMIRQVDILETISNEDYDVLLTSSVVLIDLYEASAVNTVIECIARNTPILVNRHPAIVEYLGSDYPLYFESNNFNEIPNRDQIIKAHEYLASTSSIKDQISSEKFIFDLVTFLTHLDIIT